MPRSFPTFLLDDAFASEALTITRKVGPPRHAVLVGDDGEALKTAISSSCQVWGGAAHLLLPGKAFETESDTPWRRLATSSDPEHVELVACSPEHAPKARWRNGQAVPTAVIIASLDRSRNDLAPVSIPTLDEDDPWHLAYLAVVGTLPEAPGLQLLEMTQLRRDITYDELIEVQRPEIEGCAEDLLERVRSRRSMTPVLLSLALLSFSGINDDGASRRIHSLFAKPRTSPSRTVVVYRPGNLDDACLVWSLRAASGWSPGGPLAIPITADVIATIQHWQSQGAFRFGSFMDGRCALVSASIEEEELASLVGQLGDPWTHTKLADSLWPWTPASRPSQEVVAMERGTAEVSTWSSEEIRELGRHLSRLQGLGMVARFRPRGVALPPSESLTVPSIFSNGSFYLDGYATPVGDKGSTAAVHWPTGWTILEAFARDRGLEVRPSPAGQACMALVHRLGGVGNLWLLDGANVLKVLYRLAERSGMTWFRDRMRRITTSLSEVEEASSQDPLADEAQIRSRLDRIEALLEGIVASPDDVDRHGARFDRFRDVGSTVDRRAWLRLLEDRGVLLRGTELKCELCQAKTWRPLGELSDEMTCFACGNSMPRPYSPDVLHFHYRISEMLLRVLQHDALGHLLTLFWLIRLFHLPALDPVQIVGGHPGLSFFSDGEEIGEADLFLLFTDGSCALGEYKRTGKGLTRPLRASRQLEVMPVS